MKNNINIIIFKVNFFPKCPSLAGCLITFGAIALAAATSAGPLDKAAGKYGGQLSGVARNVPFVGTQRLSNTDAILKLPRKKGRVVIKIDGFQRTTGRVDKALVRQGGNKVIQKGTTRIPSSVTSLIGLSSVTGPFKAVVDLRPAVPTVRATTTLRKSGITLKGTFVGSHR